MDTNSKDLIIIAGPTAVGKTDISLRLASDLSTDIVSCDSRQLFIETSIGTAKPSIEELASIPHHFINHLSVKENYSAGKYEIDAIQTITSLFKEKNQLILTGGTGLYMNVVLYGMDSYPDVPQEITDTLESDFEANGLSHHLKELQNLDSAYYEKVDKHNSRRVIRALGIIRHTGKTFTSFRLGQPKKRSFNPIYILLERERQELYDRINQRVDQMLSDGLEEEARGLYHLKNHKSLQTVGYQEFFNYFDGQITRNRAIELIKQNSRRYAKRQLTWFRKENHWKTFHPSDYSSIEKHVHEQIS